MALGLAAGLGAALGQGNSGRSGGLTSVYTDDLTVDPELARTDPDKAQARLTRNQYKLYERAFRQHEDAALSAALDPGAINQVADDASGRAAEAFDAQNGQAARRMSRYGIEATPAQQKVLDRKRGLSRDRVVASTENSIRDQADDARLDQLGDVLSLGAGIQQSGSAALGQAGGLARARESAYQDARARHSQSRRATNASAIGTIFSAASDFAAG